MKRFRTTPGMATHAALWSCLQPGLLWAQARSPWVDAVNELQTQFTGPVALHLRFASVEPPRPIVVQVDQVGRAWAVAYEAAETQAAPLDPTTKYFLNGFIDNFLSRRWATVEEHWTPSLRFLSTELANAAITRDGAEGELQVVLRIHANPEPAHCATADFDPVQLSREQETERERWSRMLRFDFREEIPSEIVVFNPMGLPATYLQADRALVTEDER